jgi:hypothetical protein
MASRNSNRKSARVCHPARPQPVDRAAIGNSLHALARELRAAMAVVITAVGALDAQHADGDAWIALTLRRYAGDALDREIERVKGLIAELEGTCRIATQRDSLTVAPSHAW